MAAHQLYALLKGKDDSNMDVDEEVIKNPQAYKQAQQAALQHSKDEELMARLGRRMGGCADVGEHSRPPLAPLIA